MKKVLVVFDTTYGNTEKLGREIAAGIDESGLAECKVIHIDDVEAEDISVYDGVLFGGPIHAFRATRGIKNAVKKASKMGLDGKLVAAFDTCMGSRQYRGTKGIEKIVRKKAPGARVMSPGLSSLVDGFTGPLNNSEPARAREFGLQFAQELVS
ncbi:MAG: flavodoxin family protein [Candidatus Thorarchaeota archaeon]|jgi:flavodoxin